MRYSQKWMVVPFVPKNDIKNPTNVDIDNKLLEVLNKNTNPSIKLKEYNQVLFKNQSSPHPIIPNKPQASNETKTELSRTTETSSIQANSTPEITPKETKPNVVDIDLLAKKIFNKFKSFQNPTKTRNIKEINRVKRVPRVLSSPPIHYETISNDDDIANDDAEEIARPKKSRKQRTTELDNLKEARNNSLLEEDHFQHKETSTTRNDRKLATNPTVQHKVIPKPSLLKSNSTKNLAPTTTTIIQPAKPIAQPAKTTTTSWQTYKPNSK